MSDLKNYKDEKAKTKGGDDIELFVYENKDEKIFEYGVNWRGVFGIFGIGVYTDTKEEAIALFNALKSVKEWQNNN